MTQSKWHRFFAAALVTAMLVTSLAPAVFAAEQAAPTYQQVRASEVTGTIPGGQFAKIWLGIAPERPGTVTVTAVWDRSNPEQNGLGFFVLNEANLSAVVAGQNLRDNNVGAGSTNFFLNGPDNQQGASFRATGGAYTAIVYNDSASDANFTLSVDNGVLVDDSGQVEAVGAAEEEATTETTETTEEDAAATPAAAATEAATPVATATEAAATTTTVVAAGPFRGATVEGELAEQYAQHYLGLEPEQRDGDITLRLTFDPRDNQELARRLGFWVLDDQGFRRYQAGENAGDVAVAAGNRVSTPGEDNVRSASFNASGLGSYTVIVYNNSRVPATYSLSATGGALVDDSQQTITAQEAVTSTVTTTTATPAATTTTTTTTTTTAAATTAGTGVVGQPGGTYTVQSGDTLAIIARDVYGDFRLYEQLCAFNNIADCNIIEVGQVINLPTNEEIGATGTTATTTTAAATPAATVAATPAATTVTTATTATTGTTTTATTAVTTTTPVTTTGTTTGTTTTRPTTGSTATGTIAQVAANNPNFSILAQALEATGLDATLSSGEFTVFAPTDAAFNAFVDLVNEGIETANAALPAGASRSPLMTTETLLQSAELATILRFHMLSGEVLASDVTNGMKATSVQGQPLTFEVKDGSVYINGAKVTITDIPATNGVIHAISAVILPPAE